MTAVLQLSLPLQILLIFFLSRTTINELFYFLRIFLKNDHLVYSFVSLIFFPGTIIHEMGHFVAATVLGLHVVEVKILPQWEKNQIKLGSVLYQKKDFVRGIMVGIAPIFFALIFFWFLAKFHFFPNNNLIINIFLGYIVFAVSSTMFSSKQDLVDFALIIPVVIIIIGLAYIFDLKLDFILNNKALRNGIIDFFGEVNFYTLFSLATNVILIVLFKSFRALFHK